ncbi:MAG: C40 family peptidase [Sandaracinaceae bacterium]|nr:C40 family peptidase [Sandaracinaceae bacterium]
MGSRSTRWWLWLASALALSCGGTSGEGADRPSGERAGSEEAAACPSAAPAPHPLPGVSEAHLTLDYWLGRVGELDAPLLTVAEIAAHNRAITTDPENGLPTDRASLGRAPDPERLAREVRTRLTYLREKVDSGEYVDASGRRLDAAQSSALSPIALAPAPEVRVALAPLALRCGPRLEGLFKAPIDPAFDRNACSTVRPQEPVQVLMRWPNGMWLARTRYALGWLAADAALSPPVAEPERSALLAAAPLRARAGARLAGADGAGVELASEALLGADARTGQALFADASGVHRADARGLDPTARPLTRRAVLTEAFARLGQPYGWGGHEGGVDCSRFVMDVLGTFGLELPRHSGRQAGSGTYAIDLSGVADLDERLRLLDAAAGRAIVLLHFPGHIMLYLGRDASGAPMAIHAFSEYLEACPGGGEGDETLRRVDRVTVSDLSLGQGTSRRSFLERLERLVLLGQRVGPELIGTASARAAAPVDVPAGNRCTDSLETRVFSSPERPNTTQPLRVFVTATRELGPVELAAIDPEGRRRTPSLRRLGGPPFTYVAELPRPAEGRWTFVLGDGPNVAACERINVSRFAPRADRVSPDAVWEPRFRWEADTEALFAAFVEALFDFPIEQELTWPNLSVLLDDPRQNLLHNHFAQGEEARIPLRPDCADLPYFLRTYFAWKMRLPFGYRSCTRGRRGNLPVCEELRTPIWEHGRADPVDAFRDFINTQVKRGVHSASGRTHPEDSETALYPVPLTREALRPGTVYADPYGHLLVVARWIPQGIDGYGILVGADAQPDGTVGRRRFWRGSFLFSPDTTSVGAGFKAWRPVVYERRDRAYRSLDNAQITERAGYVPFSMQQYRGSTDDFYDAMEALINPRALDPLAVQLSLIDALGESTARRVVSVQNGEDWVARNPSRTMEMPEGGAIFQTGGPWEEYATPSRDMRLLIAIDTVVGFPEAMRRDPARWGLTEATLEAAIARVRARAREELATRRYAYTRSDGASQSLTLADVVARAAAFEVAYNPNDCVELRWGAPDGSAELGSCRRHAPASQRALMGEYREWFHTRRRPVW